MIILFLFLSLYIGINIRVSIILGIIEACLLIGFIIYRFSKKTGLLALSFCLIGVGLSFIRPSFNKEIYSSIVIEVKNNYFIASSSFEKFYINEKNTEREIGDIIELKGYKKELDFITIESDFDFKEYLNSKGIYSEFVPSSLIVKFSNPLKIHKIKKQFLNNFDKDTKSLVSSLLFGESIQSETASLFKDLQLFRLISNTGIFLRMFVSIVVFLLDFIFKEKHSSLISILILTLYSIFTFPRFVVIKLIFIQILRWINKYKLKDRFSYLTILSGSGIIFLLLDYNLAYQDTFALTYFVPLISLVTLSSFRRFKSFKKKVITSIVIFLFLIPFNLKMNHEINLLALPFQIGLFPLMICYSIGGLMCLIGIPIQNGMNSYTYMIKNILNYLNKFPSSIYADKMTDFVSLIFYLALIFLIYVYSIGLKDLYKLSTSLFVGITLLQFIPLKNVILNSVNFINVGQGDACLIHYNNSNILIDTGGSIYNDIATNTLIPYFKKKQIYTIDLLITTHNDYDHSGAVDSLVKHFKVKNYLHNYEQFPYTYKDFKIENLNTYNELWNGENDSSLVLKFSVNSITYLIMGDAPTKIEKALIKNTHNLRCDILKIGHHGSDTSTCEDFLKTIKPKEAVISVGKNNHYGHPHSSVINLLNKYSITIRRTDIEGTISYYTYVWA